MKLTREQELYLIDLGVAALLDSAMHDNGAADPDSLRKRADALAAVSGNGHRQQPDELTTAITAQTARTKRGRRWTQEQHEKYAATMAKKWGRKRKAASA